MHFQWEKLSLSQSSVVRSIYILGDTGKIMETMTLTMDAPEMKNIAGAGYV
jgi:hypothetical protein